MKKMGKILMAVWPIAIIVFIFEQKSGGKLGIGVASIVLLLLVTLFYFIIRLFRKRPITNFQTDDIKKDAWYLAYRNFIQIFYVWVILIPILVIMYLTKQKEIQNLTIIGHLQFFLSGILWFSLGMLFKRRNKSAILIGYISISILLVASLFSGLNIILIIIYGYFLSVVYKASKTPEVKTSWTS